MNRLHRPSLRVTGAILCSLALASCSDDPELVRQREEQKIELSKLGGELEILKEKLERKPLDRGPELAELKTQSETNAGQIEALEAEIEGLERQKAAIEAQHEAYRRKYVVR
jgi:chromosome segregation ATPase